LQNEKQLILLDYDAGINELDEQDKLTEKLQARSNKATRGARSVMSDRS